MKIVVVHLSDIHLKTGINYVLDRTEQIASAIASVTTEASLYFLIISGDVAFSGREEEYELATNFILEIKRKLEGRQKNALIKVVIVPGNHDCNFRAPEQDIRDILIKHLNNTSETVKPDVISRCLANQNEFFTFLNTFSDEDLVFPKTPQVFYNQSLTRGNKTISFNCYNTAWMSQLQEKQGQLKFPLNPISSNTEADLSISIFHHPYNWLESTVGLEFRRRIEETSDLILTGHEHTADSYRKETMGGVNVEYIEGAVLQDGSPSTSGFNVLLLDLEKEDFELTQYFWKDEKKIYRPLETLSKRFSRNRLLAKKGLSNKPEFTLFLNDPGNPFLHPYKQELKLRDIFVYPSIEGFSVLRKLKGKSSIETTGGSEFISQLLTEEVMIIYGSKLSGKTTFGKILYTDLRQQNIIPILVNGNDCQGLDEAAIKKTVNAAFNNQYDEASAEEYKQLPREQKALIIDDFHKFKANDRAKALFLKQAKELFGLVIVFANDMYRLKEFDGNNNEISFLSRYQLKEFGNLLRGRLIRKWTYLGREYTADESELKALEQINEGIVNTALQAALPSYPLFILVILQVNAPNAGANANVGSYGYIFEELITNRLRRVSQTADDIDGRYTFLGKVAFFLFNEGKHEISETEFYALTAEYNSEYKLQINREKLIRDLEGAALLDVKDGHYRFTYPYIYYYFVARYIKDSLADNPANSKLKDLVLYMVKCLSYEPYYNVLLILVYLTKDRNFIEAIIDQSRAIYAQLSPADFVTDVQFLNELKKHQRNLILADGDTDTNRNNFRKMLDESAEDEDENDSTALSVISTGKSLIGYHEGLDEFTKATIALKNIELLGQIIRNFPGSLKGDLKESLAEECYMLGLRLLKQLLELTEQAQREFREKYLRIVKDVRVHISETEALHATDELIVWLAEGACFGILKKVSQSVGHEKLGKTYVDVHNKHGQLLSVKLIDLTIRLDHLALTRAPMHELEQVKRAVKSNVFAETLVRDLVYHYLLLNPVLESDRQSLCKKFNISHQAQNVLFLANDNKRPDSTKLLTQNKKRTRKKRQRYENDSGMGGCVPVEKSFVINILEVGGPGNYRVFSNLT